jgi:hypothetical protein
VSELKPKEVGCGVVGVTGILLIVVLVLVVIVEEEEEEEEAVELWRGFNA